MHIGAFVHNIFSKKNKTIAKYHAMCAIHDRYQTLVGISASKCYTIGLLGFTTFYQLFNLDLPYTDRTIKFYPTTFSTLTGF